jgi:hypothetical protein
MSAPEAAGVIKCDVRIGQSFGQHKRRLCSNSATTICPKCGCNICGTHARQTDRRIEDWGPAHACTTAHPKKAVAAL